MYKRPFDNKSNYDPGRFRTSVAFYQQVSVQDNSGGSDLSLEVVYEAKAVELQVRDGNQLEINVGASVMNDDRYFVIRRSRTFTPEKDMNLMQEGKYFVVRAIIPVDNTNNYTKLLCTRKADYAEWRMALLLSTGNTENDILQDGEENLVGGPNNNGQN